MNLTVVSLCVVLCCIASHPCVALRCVALRCVLLLAVGTAGSLLGRDITMKIIVLVCFAYSPTVRTVRGKENYRAMLCTVLPYVLYVGMLCAPEKVKKRVRTTYHCGCVFFAAPQYTAKNIGAS
jgi:hypothetical protein